MSQQIPPTPPPPSPPPGNARGCLAAVATVAAMAFVVLLLIQLGGDDGDDTDDSASSSYSSPAYEPSTYAPTTTDDPYETSDPYATPTYAAPTTEEPSPYTSGTCLNGALPDSTTAQEVDDVDEVDCSASDAHYKVIETIPMTSDLTRCSGNSATEYAFSSRYTMNGTVINEYVYCLVGLGSYAR
ncbi:hypothetical protein [Streptomyces sp. NPDC052225]|uniref:LppU/SCO3897 family protein n=1 Tax=Streptomyces sp. NPDC052225 TaxID=3154949 RepID=UPI0034249EAF